MAELLVRTQDRLTGDAAKDVRAWRRGMVITVQEDGWAWGKEELTNPLFAIVKIPGMTVAAAGVFTGNLIKPAKDDFDTTNPIRAFKINLDSPVLAGKTTATISSAQATLLKIAVDITNPLIIS